MLLSAFGVLLQNFPTMIEHSNALHNLADSIGNMIEPNATVNVTEVPPPMKLEPAPYEKNPGIVCHLGVGVDGARHVPSVPDPCSESVTLADCKLACVQNMGCEAVVMPD